MRRDLVWVLDRDLPAEAVVVLEIGCSGRAEALGRADAEPPLVSLIMPDGAVAQRVTGGESATRADEVLTLEDHESALGV